MIDKNPEPDINEAFTWWSELPAKWTTVGWKDSLFRFNVLFNGMVSAVPCLNRRTLPWKSQGVQLGVWPAAQPGFPGHVTCPQDQGMILQGWDESRETPVLWSEWAHEGMLLRSTVFAHSPGAKALERGDEPLFLWMRFSIHQCLPALPLPPEYGFNLNLNTPYIKVGAMSIRYNLAVERDARRYPRELSCTPEAPAPESGLTLTEPDGRVRLAVLSGDYTRLETVPEANDGMDWLVYFGMPTEEGRYVDALLPIYPVTPEVFQKELSLGYEGALTETEQFWKDEPGTLAHIQTPEIHINQSIRRSLQNVRMIAERNPQTGHYSLLTGGWCYADMWATISAMNSVMLLDGMGMHPDAVRYLRAFADTQGQPMPSGQFWKKHPGSLGAIPGVAACDWASDHGAVLWSLAEHYLLTEDQQYLREFLPVILKACEFIRDSRAITGHPGVPGLLPPGIATDMPTEIQAVWNDAWNYRGLRSAVNLLRRIGHPDAGSWQSELADYREVFVDALRKASDRQKTWTDDSGQVHRLVPLAVYGEQDFEYRNAFYLDTGPMVLVFAGLLEPDDPMIISTLKWFREGPPAKIYRYDGDCWQVPALHREMSSCEPCYSWNIFISHALGDRLKYLEGMYSLFAGSISRQTYTMCETRGGITACSAAHVPVWLVRLAMVDDQIKDNELHLLRLMPLAWLVSGGSQMRQMPTVFGPLDISARLSGDSRELHVEYTAPQRRKPARTLLHIPPVEGLERVVINGDAREARPGMVVDIEKADSSRCSE